MARRTKRKARSGGAGKGWLAWVLGSADNFDGYFAQSRSLALSFVLIAPLLLLYEVALIYYPPVRAQGAGRFVRDLLSGVFHSRAGIVLNIAVVLLLLLAVFVLAKRGGLRLNLIIPMVLESAGWAAALVGIAVLVYHRLPRFWIQMCAAGSSPVKDVIGSIGAGVYEEILFRLFLTSALYLAGLRLFQERTGYAACFAVTISSVVFAMCHGTTLNINFLFYFASGVFFSALYTYRGLGVAVYTHVIYDIVVLLGRT